MFMAVNFKLSIPCIVDNKFMALNKIKDTFIRFFLVQCRELIQCVLYKF